MNGLADPSAIIQTFWVDDGLGSLVRLHQTVALIDAKNFPSKFKSEELAKEERKSQRSLL
jgi:G3E family GTPase